MPVTSNDRPRQGWDVLAEPCDVELWRKEVGALVADLGGDGRAVEVARHGVSELLTNVITHVEDRACRLEVLRDENGICVRVFDRSRVVPAVRVAPWDAETGRGLWLLREMADAMGYVLTASGKWVWFRIAVPDAGRVAA
jgi:anti-sigma regulatory factor (Ser/Thr protein kinase)